MPGTLTTSPNHFNVSEAIISEAVEHLMKKGLINQDQISMAQRQLQRLQIIGVRSTVEDLLIVNGFVTRNDVNQALASKRGVVRIDDQGQDQDSETLRRFIKPALCRRLGFIPVKLENGILYVASLRPLQQQEVEEIIYVAKLEKLRVNSIAIEPLDKREVLDRINSDALVDFDSMNRKIERLNANPDDGQNLKQVINDLFIDAVQARSSDIHIDAVEDPASCWISFRIDGDLRYRYILSVEAVRRIVTRLKDMAGMDFSDVRRPQDGRSFFHYESRKIDVRVASLPIDGGETLTMRLLDPNSLKTLDDLFQDSPMLLKRMKSLVGIRNKIGGVVLLSGPTGSGKSTTLYAIIRQLDRYRLNVMTAEDPVEYRVPFVRQAQVNAEAGASFASILRSQLRHDPDILVIGELRDGITAETALRSAESGHFVLTTVHAADALQSIERVMGMFAPEYRHSGIYVLANYLWAIVNQRLVKRVCKSCGLPMTMQEAESKFDRDFSIFHIEPYETIMVANPEGCPDCRYTGNLGRALLAETLFFPVDPDARLSISAALLDGRLSDVARHEKVVFQKRSDTAAALLRRGVVDPEVALAATEALA
jgi:type II secretory ATPase GspE/PulE/Tfp pilus assembly ATPase PilB-like protein